MINISIVKEIIWNDKMTVSFQREIGIQISTIKNIMYKDMLSDVLSTSKMKIKHTFQEG